SSSRSRRNYRETCAAKFAVGSIDVSVVAVRTHYGCRLGCHAQLPRRFEPAEHRRQVDAENVGEISALLHENRWHSESCDGPTDATEAVCRHGEASERIVFRRIEPKCDHQCIRCESTNGFLRSRERPQVAVVAGTFRQGNIEIGTEPRAGA